MSHPRVERELLLAGMLETSKAPVLFFVQTTAKYPPVTEVCQIQHNPTAKRVDGA